uniref:Cyclin-dependent kinase inhibitor 1B n=1 Tax=Mola mola TaxID=94237 RepID=A0A3Q4AGE0_MOLML
MSDVRLSNASPTVERVDARQPDTVRTPVRRNLFGSPDREEVRRYLSAAIQESVQDFREEYNFDPVSERPLTPRSYDWQEDSDAPEFYRRAPHGSHRPPESSRAQAGTVLDLLSPALPLNLKTTRRAGPEEKRGNRTKKRKKVESYRRPRAPITAEGRKADHLGGNQSASSGRERGQHRLFFSYKHTPTN